MDGNFGIVKDESEPVDTFILPVTKDELRLIKIGLFEISEFLGSPMLRQLQQRVNSVASTHTIKLPAESVFNSKEFKEAEASYIAAGNIVYVSMKEPA